MYLKPTTFANLTMSVAFQCVGLNDSATCSYSFIVIESSINTNSPIEMFNEEIPPTKRKQTVESGESQTFLERRVKTPVEQQPELRLFKPLLCDFLVDWRASIVLQDPYSLHGRNEL